MRLTLAGLVPAFDFGVLPDDRFFYTHKASASRSLLQVVQDLSDPKERLWSIAHHMIEALHLLDYLHEAGTTHRDINAAQIRVGTDGTTFLEGYINARPKVEARNLIKIVNMPYMAPEQLSSVQVADVKTDLYAMGAVLYELLTAQQPYDSNFKKVEDARQGVLPVPSRIADLPPEMDAITVKAMAPRAERYQHAMQMIQELDSFWSKRPIGKKIKEFSEMLLQLLPLQKRSL